MFHKKSKEEWEAEALQRESQAALQYATQYANVTDTNALILLLCAEIRGLKGELKWCSSYLKRLANAQAVPTDDKVPF